MRDAVLTGYTRAFETNCGKLYVTVNSNQQGSPCEVFINMGKAGGCASSQTEALGRILTLALQQGADVKDIVKQLQGIQCHHQVYADTNCYTPRSCADAVAKCLLLGDDNDLDGQFTLQMK